MLSLEERKAIAKYIITNEKKSDSGDKALSHAYKEQIQNIVNSLTLEDLFEIDEIVMSELSKQN